MREREGGHIDRENHCAIESRFKRFLLIKQILYYPFQLILLYLKPCESLPPWVHRVDSCPDPNDIRQWIKASTRLNCLHDLTSTDPNEQANVYHCLPTAFVNETVEFCSRNVPVAPGTCFFSVYFSLNSSTKNIYGFLVLKQKIFLNTSTVHRLHTFKGNCPVYNYKFGPNVQATYYNCSSFTSGCPAHMFHSKNVFKCKYVHVCRLVYHKFINSFHFFSDEWRI